jgi:pimeloyl-ACP methyl ester carboxylesterase
VQVLTHGLGFDRSYWDFPAQEYKYSYVNKALERGYSTLAWDRLGIGASSHGEPVNEIQSALEIAALIELTKQLRAGALPGVPAPKKVIHGGHSFGSILSYSISAAAPALSDGLLLTGFSQNTSFVSLFALGGNYVNAKTLPFIDGKAYPAGYVAPGDLSGSQVDFFAPGMFDPAILKQAYETGTPPTVGELVTIGGLTGEVNNFTGPALIITGGKFDVPPALKKEGQES